MSGWYAENAWSINADLDRIHAAEEDDLRLREGWQHDDCPDAECRTCKRVFAKEDFAFPYECRACADDAMGEYLAERECAEAW